jgi:hypothetical protein
VVHAERKAGQVGAARWRDRIRGSRESVELAAV